MDTIYSHNSNDNAYITTKKHWKVQVDVGAMIMILGKEESLLLFSVCYISIQHLLTNQ